MWGDYYGHMNGFGLGFGWIFTLVFWGLVIWVVVTFIQKHSGQGCRHGNCGHKHDGNGQGDSAINILKERYAKGEINKEEFESKKKDLE